MPDASEQLSYHALVIRSHSDYGKLSGWRREFGAWSNAYRALEPGEADTLGLAEDLVRKNISLILREDDRFPEQLREIPNAPWGIYCLGKLPATDPSIGIVGGRKATPTGLALAREFGERLGRAGLTIVSGLALGADAAAHAGALAGKAPAVAVVAGGLDVIAPRTNQRLAEDILEAGGAILSEYPPGTESLPYRFLERNRIVSGLCRGVLIIEASLRSGSLVTARFALEQNRDIFVIPGPARHPNYGGSHRLIRAGAELVTAPEEIMESLGIPGERLSPGNPTGDSPEEIRILTLLASAGRPLDIDKIIEGTNLNTQIALQALSFLIIKQLVREEAAGYVLS